MCSDLHNMETFKDENGVGRRLRENPQNLSNNMATSSLITSLVKRFLPLLVGAGFLLIQIGLQIFNGTYLGEFGGHPDEAAHYVTGLMVRDYMAQGFPEEPLAFAENYYLHYPKVALGHWPPLFYVTQGVWTLLFTPSRLSMMVFLSVLTTLFAFSVFHLVRQELGSKLGILGGVLTMVLPVVQKFSGMVMAEILVGFLSLWAVIYFGRFLKSERWQDAVGFGMWSTFAILTKGNALALGLIPPIAILLTGRYELFTRPALWLSAVIVFVLCGPWYALTLQMASNTWVYQVQSGQFFIEALSFYSWHFLTISGFLVSLLIAIGLWTRIVLPFKTGRMEPQWAAFGALLGGVLIFHCMVPSSLEERNLLSAVPALILFFAAGCVWLGDQISVGAINRERWVTTLAFVVTAVFMGEAFATTSSFGVSGLGEVAQRLVATPAFDRSVFLVSSDSRGEGAFISEVARREKRPGHIVLRASKVLSRAGWNNENYEPLFYNEADVLDYLEGIPIGLVILDVTASEPLWDLHQILLKNAIDMNADKWVLLGVYPAVKENQLFPEGLHVYRQVGHEEKSISSIQLDMRLMLKKFIELPSETEPPRP